MGDPPEAANPCPLGARLQIRPDGMPPEARPAQGPAAWFVQRGVFGYLRAPHPGPVSAGSLLGGLDTEGSRCWGASQDGVPYPPPATPGLPIGTPRPIGSSGSVNEGWPNRPIESSLTRPK